MQAERPPYGNGTLPEGIRSRLLPGINGLTVHVLEAGFEPAGRPLVMLLHGFPELAYSWRKIMLPLARAGFHVVAADQRGYGRTTGWDPSYDASTHPFGFLNVVTDTLALAAALGHGRVACVVGHDAGSPAAGWCALVRPDIVRSVVMMSAPFAGPPPLPVEPGPPRPRPRRATTPSTRRWPPCRARASSTSAGTGRGRRTTTCCRRPRGSATSCGRTTT